MSENNGAETAATDLLRWQGSSSKLTSIGSNNLKGSYQRCIEEECINRSLMLDVNHVLPLPEPKCFSFVPISEKKECINKISHNSLVDEFLKAPPDNVGSFIHTLRSLFYDPTKPEFTSLQQFCWAVVIGFFFGITTALWQLIINSSINFIWRDIPQMLLSKGFFTDVNGSFPLPNYCWICTSIFGGFLSWASASIPITIPSQDHWIDSVHKNGVIDQSAFWYIALISTGGIISGLSLGPELPLVLLSGMVGSFLAVKMNQSAASGRILVLTAGGAAVGGFFGFPMAGALFVLELPHRMGLQYFEALPTANISSILAVLFNRVVTGNGLQGYYYYPFAVAPLKSHVFYIAIAYGLIGALVGTIYCKSVKNLKNWVQGWGGCRGPTLNYTQVEGNTLHGEESLLLPSSWNAASADTIQFSETSCSRMNPLHRQIRAAVLGAVAGFIVGVVGMLLPHTFFWGEAQLQTIIDGGRTQLPFFGGIQNRSESLLSWSYCLVDPEDPQAVLIGPGIQCSSALFIAKLVCIGLSIGTGIVGGQFWGPLYIGAVASNFLIDFMKIIHHYLSIGSSFFEHPCIALLCIMGSAHVVVFRAHSAIVLLLILTISAFEEGSKFFTTENYASIFPLLVVSCFVSLLVTQDVIFYQEQRDREDKFISFDSNTKVDRLEHTVKVPGHVVESKKDGKGSDNAGMNRVSIIKRLELDKNLNFGVLHSLDDVTSEHKKVFLIKLEEPPLMEI